MQASYAVDVEKIQEMFAELFKSRRTSPQRENDSFSQSSRKASAKELQL